MQALEKKGVPLLCPGCIILYKKGNDPPLEQVDRLGHKTGSFSSFSHHYSIILIVFLTIKVHFGLFIF